MQFGGLKIRFMPSHEPHCPIVLIQGQSSKVMRKDQIRVQGERSKSRYNANDTDLLIWNGRPVNVLLPFRETTCSPFSAFWWPENTIYAESWTPLSNSLIQGQISKVMGKDQFRCQGERSKVKVKRERHRPPHLKWSSWKLETICRPFSAFWRTENTIHAESWTPLSNSLIQDQSSKLLRKDQIRGQGERSKVKVKRERHSPHLKWASSKHDL